MRLLRKVASYELRVASGSCLSTAVLFMGLRVFHRGRECIPDGACLSYPVPIIRQVGEAMRGVGLGMPRGQHGESAGCLTFYSCQLAGRIGAAGRDFPEDG